MNIGSLLSEITRSLKSSSGDLFCCPDLSAFKSAVSSVKIPETAADIPACNTRSDAVTL